MDEGNKTALRHCRFLNENYFPKLYAAFIEAFSDYVIPFVLTEAQFRNHIILNAVDLDRTVGCEEGERLIGFSLNGFGLWNGTLTAYDAGTGVIPSHRRLGISREMFEMMLPLFTESRIEQFLLEVVTTNSGAIALYENLGFRTIRELALLQCDQRITGGVRRPGHVEVRDIGEPDWNELRSFWDAEPSWQNSIDAVERSRISKRILGAYFEGKCVGYIVFSSTFGRVAQLAVDRDHRHRGVGTALVLAMQDAMADGFSMQVINIDKAAAAIEFFTNLGFYERLSQYEMVKPM
jgi:ribosomal protein S18 acetylase RimI-like enzyme